MDTQTSKAAAVETAADKLVLKISALGEEIKQLTPTTAQQQSALNGVSHVMDNVKGHFEAAAAIAAKAVAGK